MTSISPPTSVATFSYPHSSSSKHTLSHISLSPVYGSATASCVAAVQGDGVWTYDLATLRPMASFTVPPSTTFVTRPISFIPSANKKSQSNRPISSENAIGTHLEDVSAARITVVGIGKGDKVRKAEEGRVLWVWRGEEPSDKESILLDAPLLDLLHLPAGRASVICVHKNGSLAALDSNLQVRPVILSSSSKSQGDLVAVGVLPLQGQSSVKVVLVSSKGVVTVVQLDLAGGRDIHGSVIKTKSLGLKKSDRAVASAEIDEKGSVTATTSDGKIIHHSLDESSVSDEPSYPQLIEAPSLPLITRIHTTGTPLAIIPAGAADLLLTSVSPSLPAVLQSTSLSTPAQPTGSSSSSTSSYISHIAVLHRSEGVHTLGAVLTHRGSEDEEESTGRSVIYTTEVTVPEHNVGINMLLGSQDRTAKYLRGTPPRDNGTISGSKEPGSEIVSQIDKLLSRGEVKAAEKTFGAWFKANTVADHSSKSSSSKAKTSISETVVKDIVRVVFTAASKSDADQTMGEDVAVDASLRGGSGSDVIHRLSGPYVPGIIGSLLDSGRINETMWSGGVVRAGLIGANDWVNIPKALRTIPNLPSSTIVSVLQATTITESTSDKRPKETQPRLGAILQEILSLPAPAPDYRAHLAKLPVDASTSLLEQYVLWLEAHVERLPLSLAEWTGQSTTTSSSGGTGTGQSSTIDTADPLPSLESLILHSNLLLDAQLSTLISHPTASDLLERMQASLEPLVKMQDTYRKIRAPVEAVLTLSRRDERRRADREAKRELLRPAGASKYGRGSKKAGRGKDGGIEVDGGLTGTNASAGGVGAGWTDEAVGKWRVEDLIF